MNIKNLALKDFDSTIINQSEIKPLQLKACKAMESYEKSVGCGSLVVGSSGNFINMSNEKKPFIFCEVCRACYPDSSKRWKENEYPCSAMHNEIHAMVRTKRSYVYTCEIGFAYWTSPLYAGGRYAGSLASGHTLTVPKEEAAKLFCSRYKATREKVLDQLSMFPEKSHDDVISLASMLMICAENLSSGLNDEIIRKTSSGDNSFGNDLSTKKKNFFLNPVNTQDKERMLLAALRRGDRNTALKILAELFSTIREISSDDLELIRAFFIELAVIFSRTAAEVPMIDECYNRCLGQLRKSRTVNELSESLHCIIDSLEPWIFSFRGLRHASALRKAERFIWENYSSRVGLKEIAAASGLSAPYFSTIFKKEVGKNLSTYLNQLRVDKAAVYLEETGLSLQEIAKACGFEDQSWFSKIFKKHLGLSPGKYREQREAEGELEK